jgi:hypothetical protein
MFHFSSRNQARASGAPVLAPFRCSLDAIDKSGRTWIGEGANRMRPLPRDYGLTPDEIKLAEASA